MARGIYTSSAGALKLEYNINYNSRSLNKSNFIKAELLSAETCTPREYSDSIVIPVEIPSLPRPRISADILFSAEMSFLLVSSTSNQQGYQSQPRQNQQLNHPRQEYQQPSKYIILENTLNTFMTQTSAYMARTDQFIQKTDSFIDRTEMRMQNQEASLKSLENEVGQISQVLKSRPIRGFPSDTEVAKGATHEQCKAISTRSGKVLNPPTKNRRGEATAVKSKATRDTDIPTMAETPASAGKDHIDPPKSKEAETNSATPQPRKDTTEEQRPPPPFPQRLRKQKQEYQYKKFFDILK
ncbi:hypothetical protein V6N12_007763 [Hibiscus sabdariffa]|uniref:Uncharacterized protein n=1 Tax=Hibiscus sabdariffa TaxID=183260 RepID=A0ABR2F2P7_9ROSI